MRSVFIRMLCATAACWAIQASAFGQADFTEGFDDLAFNNPGQYGPPQLIADGWTFVNQSEMFFSYVYGSYSMGGGPSPHDGSGYMSVGSSYPPGNYDISIFAILPPIANQQAGDEVRLWLQSHAPTGSLPATLEIRYSPSGGTNTGSGPFAVGDFTELLVTVNTPPQDIWTQYTVIVPGNGRIALRYVAVDAVNGGHPASIGIDSISVGNVAVPPASFHHEFDEVDEVSGYGPADLTDNGWIFQNNSQSYYYGGTYENGSLSMMPPQAGPGFLGVDYSSEGLPPSMHYSVDMWAILPGIPYLQAGDPVSIWLRSAPDDGNGPVQQPALFEVRYSPSGGISTGPQAFQVGDFTEVLISANPPPAGVWTQYTAAAPGGGRLALRYVGQIEPGESLTYIGIDNLVVGEYTPPPCALPSIPAEGETVVWSAAGGPHTFGCSATIPPNATVIVEPGATVHIPAGSTLYVLGTLQAIGTKGQPITFQGPGDIVVLEGQAVIEHAEIYAPFQAQAKASLSFSHCDFHAGYLWCSGGRNTVVVDGCDFALSAPLSLGGGTAAVRNTTIQSNQFFAPIIFDGCMLLENVSVNGSPLYLYREDSPQPIYLGNVSVTNAPGAGLELWGGNYLLGPGTALAGNTYPVDINLGGGIMPGSIVPATGNANNYIKAGSDFGGYAQISGFNPILADAGIPYVWLGDVFLFASELTVMPGATMQFKPSSSLQPDAGELIARGLPDAPITFDGFNQGIWDGIVNCGLEIYEYCHFNNMQYGTIPGENCGELEVANCVYSNNQKCVGFLSTVRKTQFLDNGVVSILGGNYDGQTNPNWFEGNSATLSFVADATHNWWGHPTGPASPQNPGGQGDPVGPNVPFQPFRTTPPDFENHPPVVRLQRSQSTFLFEHGNTVLIKWESYDDPPDAIVSHRLEFHHPDLGGQGGTTIVLADNLPPEQTAFQWTVPDVGNLLTGTPWIRVTSIDTLGQEGWDRKYVTIPPEHPTGAITMNPAYAGQTFIAGEPLPPFTTSGGGGIGTYNWLIFDGDGSMIPLGSNWNINAPFVSTDTARVAISLGSGGFDTEWYFTEPFAIRPDPRIGDAPPSITLASPTGGTLAGNSIVPIVWTAFDDESLRSFSIQASYDGGRTWHFIVRDLPGDATSFNWNIPPIDTPMSNVRLRVIAFDLRFQNSSDTSGVITITPSSDGAQGDVTGDGQVNVDDLLTVINAWGTCAAPCPADITGDDIVNVDDLLLIINNWS